MSTHDEHGHEHGHSHEHGEAHGHEHGHGHGHGHGGAPAPAADDTPAGTLSVVIVLVLLFMWGSISAIIPLVKRQLAGQEAKVVWSREPAEKHELRAAEDAALGTAGKNDDGTYRLPFQDAKKILLSNPALLGGLAASAAAPAATAAVPEGVDPAVLAKGQELFAAKTCVACHTTDGKQGVGPTFKGLLGRTETLSDGSTVVVDEAYIKKSIMEPNAQIVQGFLPNLMPPLAATMSEEEVAALVTFVSSIR